MDNVEKLEKLLEKIAEKKQKNAEKKAKSVEGYAACKTPTEKADYIAGYLGLIEMDEAGDAE